MKSTTTLYLYIFIFIISLTGSILLGLGSSSQTEPELAFGVVSVTIVASVHSAIAVGASHRNKPREKTGSEDDWASVRDPIEVWNVSLKPKNLDPSAIDRRYRSALDAALFDKAITLLITSTTLDGGVLFRIGLIAAAAHAIAVLMIVLRSPFKPSKIDL